VALRANTSLFRSLLALYAGIALVIVFAALGFRLPPPWHAGGPRSAMLVSGWATFGSMLVLFGYVLRKYMHKLGYSPEFRRRITLETFEGFEKRLNRLREECLREQIRDPAAIRARLSAVLEGVEGVQRVDIVPGDGPNALPRLVARPTEPFGRTARWLHAHLYFGVLFAVLVLLHARAGFHSPLGVLLNGTAALLTLTGVVGIALWSVGPTWLSRKEREHKLSIEQAFVFRKHYKAKVTAALSALSSAPRAALEELWKARRAADFGARARLALAGPAFSEAETLAAGREACVLMGQYRRVLSALRATTRVRLLYMGWRYIHIPCAVWMLALAALHAFSVWKY
jgi:hypothetical protein